MLIKAVIQRQAKDAVRLEPNGKWSGTGAPNSPVADGAPPADKARPNPGAIKEVNEVTLLSPREGRRTAKNADEAAEEG